MKDIVRIACAAACAAVLTVNAEPTAPAARTKARGMTPEMRQKVLEKFGDTIVNTSSQRGKVAFVNTQDEVDHAVFEELAAGQAKELKLRIVCEKAKAGDPAAIKSASKADVAVVIVADETTPTMLAACEDGWAVVNVRKLAVGLSTEDARKKFLPGRCQREALKAFALVSGGMASRYPDNIIAAKKISDLDLCKTFIPADTKQAVLKSLMARGVTPLRSARYLQACQEGWAPAPTNDIQKAIWDKVHAIPSKPLKIEYNEKRDKGK